jgi:CRP/FNR family transcriptional regulator
MSVLDEIERFEPFRGLNADSRALLARGAVGKACVRGVMALHKGQRVSGAYVVLGGRLRVFSLAPNGTEATLYFIDPGETCVLALNCLFNDFLYPAWVQAEADSTIALIPGAVYRKLFEREPAIQDMTVHTLSTLVFRLMSELEFVHSSHHRQRLANFILIHASSDGVLRMTQQQLAQHLGTTREVIARLLQEFVAKRYVRTQRGAIAIKDLFALRRVVSPEAA